MELYELLFDENFISDILPLDSVEEIYKISEKYNYFGTVEDLRREILDLLSSLRDEELESVVAGTKQSRKSIVAGILAGLNLFGSVTPSLYAETRGDKHESLKRSTKLKSKLESLGLNSVDRKTAAKVGLGVLGGSTLGAVLVVGGYKYWNNRQIPITEEEEDDRMSFDCSVDPNSNAEKDADRFIILWITSLVAQIIRDYSTDLNSMVNALKNLKDAKCADKQVTIDFNEEQKDTTTIDNVQKTYKNKNLSEISKLIRKKYTSVLKLLKNSRSKKYIVPFFEKVEKLFNSDADEIVNEMDDFVKLCEQIAKSEIKNKKAVLGEGVSNKYKQYFGTICSDLRTNIERLKQKKSKPLDRNHGDTPKKQRINKQIDETILREKDDKTPIKTDEEPKTQTNADALENADEDIKQGAQEIINTTNKILDKLQQTMLKENQKLEVTLKEEIALRKQLNKLYELIVNPLIDIGSELSEADVDVPDNLKEINITDNYENIHIDVLYELMSITDFIQEWCSYWFAENSCRDEKITKLLIAYKSIILNIRGFLKMYRNYCDQETADWLGESIAEIEKKYRIFKQPYLVKRKVL